MDVARDTFESNDQVAQTLLFLNSQPCESTGQCFVIAKAGYPGKFETDAFEWTYDVLICTECQEQDKSSAAVWDLVSSNSFIFLT